jgi:hypothetical protein
MRDELAESAVQDFVLAGPESIRAVLTLSTEFFSEQTGAYLLAGDFTVVGRVTRVLRPGENINLTRRSAFGLTATKPARLRAPSDA